MYCRYCGADNPDGSRYCRQCGKALMENGQIETENVDFNESCDLFQRIVYYRDNRMENSKEYSDALYLENKAYFAYKLFEFFSVLLLLFSTELFALSKNAILKILVIIVMVGCYFVLFNIYAAKMGEITNIDLSIHIFSDSNDKYEQNSNYIERELKKEHRNAFKIFNICNVIVAVFGILFFIGLYSEDGFWWAVYGALILTEIICLLMLCIWTFKFFSIVVIIALLLLSGITGFPSAGDIWKGDKSNIVTEDVMLENNVEGSIDGDIIKKDDSVPEFATPELTYISDELHAKIDGAYLSETRSGDAVIVVNYSWTNVNSNDAAAAFNISISAYQKGIELETAYSYSADDYDLGMSQRDIRPGITINLQKAFLLLDNESDVEVEITPWLSFEDNPPKAFHIFSISQ